MSKPATPTPILQVPLAAEYALRVVVCLAHAAPGVRVSREELAAAVNLPSAYAAKVLRKLVLAGLVEAQRGWHGGFALARPPDEVRVLDVLIAVGVESAVEHCAFGFEACDAEHPCPLHDMWRDLHDRLHTWAAETTLHTLASTPGRRWPPCPGRAPADDAQSP